MPQMRNTVTGKINWMPDSYIGQFPFEVVEEAPVVEEIPAVEEAPVEEKPRRKRKADYTPEATDGDGDGLVQDGTIFERPEGVELSEEEIAQILKDSEEA
jgi:hypothetical protein